ncbi:MAG: hypothetical protein EA377_05545, partial [Phycisphaerales bacterium]
MEHSNHRFGFCMMLLIAALAAPSSPAATHDDDAIDQDQKSAHGEKLHVAAGHEQMRYLQHGPGEDVEPPDDGFKLLLVLPGGDGGGDFAPFLSRVHSHSLDDTWILAQMIAPVWSEDQPNQIVWPTSFLRWPTMEFTTEAFIDAVVADVQQRHAVDQQHIYALGWSSGGPPVYAAAMREETALRGAFVAMSIFREHQCPPAKHARERSFYLLHSPDDFIAMDFPHEAKRVLREAGARVTLVEYEGGHGWRGDP